MSDKSQDISRRTFFRNMMAYAVGTAAFLSALPDLALAQTKMAQKIAKYQDTPKDGKACEQCTLFVAPDSCKMVDGKISAKGFCMLFSHK